MKKKALIAMLLACSLTFGTVSMSACNLIGGGDGDGERQEQGDVTVAVTGVELNKDTLNLKTGDSETLIATVAPTGATTKSVTWKSSDDAVATVDQSGKVTAHAVGTATITVTTVSGNKTDTCTVNVTEEPPAPVKVVSVSLSLTSKTLSVGENVTLIPTITPSDADNKSVSWSSSDPTVASVAGGVVTAHKAGTATITVTTQDGNKTATCAITVNPTTPTTVRVTGVELDKTSASIKVNQTVQLTATVKPADASNRAVIWQSGNTAVATVDNNGLVTAVSAGTATVTVKTDDGNFTKTCTVTVEAASQPVVDAKISYSYAGNECAAFEWADTNAANATVEYKLSTANSYTALTGNDKNFLVRQLDSTTARVDLVGLKGGAVYDFKITTSTKEVLTASDMTIHSYDRSGYAHFGKSDGVGAYKDDGTPKDNAVIVYVNEANKNTVTANGQTGIVNILKNAGTTKPLIVRVVGTVGAATWKEGNVTYTKTSDNTDSSNNLLPSAIKDKNGTSLATAYNLTTGIKDKKYNADITQKTLLDDNRNELDTSVYAELQNLSSKIKWDAEKQEFDSAWNDCSISGVKNVTVEGIGEDAKIFQWGMTFKNSSSIEVRNITFEDYTEDACSFEGSETGAANLAEFKSGNIWVHHNIFEEGNNYWDVCKEQDKHDGDGSTDFKGLKNITLSYNVYNGTHKTGLIGGSDSQSTANVTFHHNAYNKCNSRMPLGRQANMHMYNNYYNGSTGQNMSLRSNAYAFIENCYFNNANNPILLESGAAAKVLGCVFSSKQPASNSNLKIVTDRSTEVQNSNKFAPAFDIGSTYFYYKDGKSDVTVMFTAEETKTYVPQLAGVQKHGGDVTLGGAGGGSGSGTGTENPGPTPSGALTDSANVVGAKTANTVLLEVKNGGSNVAKVTLLVSGTEKNGGTLVESNGSSASAEGHIQVDNTNALKLELAEGYTYTVTIYAGSSSNEATRDITIDGVKQTTGIGAACKALTWNLNAGTYTSTESAKIRIAKIVIVATPV